MDAPRKTLTAKPVALKASTDSELADQIEALMAKVGDLPWGRNPLGEDTSIYFAGKRGGFNVRKTHEASARAELIVKTINSLPRIVEILRRGS